MSGAVPGLLATFSIHVSHCFTREELESLARWLEESPRAKSSNLKLESFKVTNLLLSIFEVDQKCLARIQAHL